MKTFSQFILEAKDNITDHISKALSDEHPSIRRRAIQHPNATVDHISKALDDKDDKVRWWAIRHPKATTEHISKALSDEHLDVQNYARKKLSKLRKS